jgi:uncharacterized protein YgiM (DUF1202 family)
MNHSDVQYNAVTMKRHTLNAWYAYSMQAKQANVSLDAGLVEQVISMLGEALDTYRYVNETTSREGLSTYSDAMMACNARLAEYLTDAYRTLGESIRAQLDSK